MLNNSWIDELRRATELDEQDLPVLWDIDFIATGKDSYALCEINVNSVSPSPEAPVDTIAATLTNRVRSRSGS